MGLFINQLVMEIYREWFEYQLFALKTSAGIVAINLWEELVLPLLVMEKEEEQGEKSVRWRLES